MSLKLNDLLYVLCSAYVRLQLLHQQPGNIKPLIRLVF